MANSLLISGANRGIGLELTRQYATAGWRVFACCRAPERADALQRLAADNPNIRLHPLDVTNREQIESLARALTDQPIDILFNNAGIYGPYDVRFGHTDTSAWRECFEVNCIAPMKLTEALVDNVAASEKKIVAAMTSKMGSMADNGSGGSYLYRSSKAALNAAMKSAAIDLKPRGITVALLHPGWVLTDMGGPNAEITTEQSAQQLRRILDQLTPTQSGTFFDIDGSVIPW